MSRDISIVFVHGIHAHEFSYSHEMQRRLIKHTPKPLRGHLKFKSVFWADIVRGRSQLYLHQARAGADIVDNQYRRLVVEGLGDAAAYQKTRTRANSAYYQIQDRITDALRDADSREDPERPLVFIGHSLGCHIISSYVWDTNRLKQLTQQELMDWDDPELTARAAELADASPYRRLDTFAGFVTMGSNMPLFTFTFGPDKVYPISRSPAEGRSAGFPGGRISQNVLAKAKWLNFYSRNDILGYPLKPLNTAYNQESRLIDVKVTSEGRFRAQWFPPSMNIIKAHTGYWRDPTVVSQTAQLVVDVITADDAIKHQGKDGKTVAS